MQKADAGADEKIVIRRSALIAAMAALACAAPAAASASPTILVKFASASGASAKVASLGDDLTGKTAGGVQVVDPQPGESVADALARYRARPDVLYAEANRVLHLADLSAPSDTWYGDQWALPAISALGGWSLFPGTFSPSPSVPIGIVDTGVDATHPDLAGRVSSSSATCLSSTCTEGVPTDDDGHGTHVSGIAGAATDNALGVAGLSFASPLIVARVFPPDAGQGADLSDVANGITWAASHGAKVINLSLGGAGSYPVTLCNAVQLAISSYGAVVVAAAGNGTTSAPFYPAACPGAVGVAATDSTDLPGTFSNYGSPDVFVSAPGVDVLSTWPANQYATASGTSMASPYTAALVGLIRSMHPEASVTQVRMMLAMTSDKVGGWAYGPDPYATCAGCTWETHYGYGRIDVQSALSSAVPAAPPPPPPPPPPAPPAPPPPPPSVRDTKAPIVHVYAASGRHRKLLRLRYRVQDDGGRTSERLLVYRKTKVLKSFTRALRTTDDAVAYWATFKFATRGSYRYCVRATDAAGNRSPLVCAAVRIR